MGFHKYLAISRRREMLLILSKFHPFSACGKQNSLRHMFFCGDLCMCVCSFFLWLQHSNFASRIFLSWPPRVWVKLQSRTLVCLCGQWAGRASRRTQLTQCFSKLVSIGDRMSIKGFLSSGSMGSDLFRIFSLNPPCLSCLLFVGEPMLQIWLLPSTRLLCLTLLSVPCKLVLVRNSTVVPIFTLLQSQC